MPGEPPKVRTKAPRRPTRRGSDEQRPINPMRDARIAAAFERGDDRAALREFTGDPDAEFPEEPSKKPV